MTKRRHRRTKPQKPNKAPITAADFQSPKRIRIPGFRGAFMDAHFDDDGNSKAPVNPATIEALQKQFPQITVEEI